MNRNYLIAFTVTAAVLTLLALAGWALFEIEPTIKYLPPSREARRNEYLALDRWLQSRGIPVREESSGGLSMISNAPEKHIFIQASLFRWNNEAPEYLAHWVEEGGHLYLILDYQTISASYLAHGPDWVFPDEVPFLLLKEFGITAGEGAEQPGLHYNTGAPSFDHGVSFEISEEYGALNIRDWTGLTRLIQVNRGKGKFTVSARPRFLLSEYLDRAPNARLAWAVFGAEGEAWLFIRGATKVQGLFGSLWRQGNLSVLIVSILVLIIICFWAVLPLFGLVKEDDEEPGKPLRERFLAEGRFLKRYGALDIYRETYLKEIKRRLARKESLLDNDKIEKRLLEIYGSPAGESAMLVRFFRGGRLAYGEFPKMVIIFKTILERI